MGAPTVPFYGKDSDRLAKLSIAHKALVESGNFLIDWPSRVADAERWKERIEAYQAAYQSAIHCDRRAIAQRIETCNEAGATWQKIVNYACSTEQDNTEMLERMGVSTKPRRTASSNVPRELHSPDFSVVNLDQKGVVRASCPTERRRYTYDLWITEGDPRNDEGWFHRASFGDCTKMDMDGFQPGKEVSFRCRIIGKDNTVGPWSHTITIMVT